MDNLTIRPARLEDEERLAEIIVAAFGESTIHARREKLYGILGGITWQQRKAEEIRNTLRSRPDCVWVAELNGKIVGFVTYILHDGELGEIGNNAVDPAFQGRGIGKALYKHVLNLMREKGCRYVEVETGLDEAYAAARAAYEKVGFRPLFQSIRYTMKLK
ncbi:MAG: GNAT family N-acetyltransferase [Armatimonadota bacterium]|nr:GNAT family N-acetyltransferase [Armatimonadota bacterium]